MDEIMVMLQF